MGTATVKAAPGGARWERDGKTLADARREFAHKRSPSPAARDHREHHSQPNDLSLILLAPKELAHVSDRVLGTDPGPREVPKSRRARTLDPGPSA